MMKKLGVTICFSLLLTSVSVIAAEPSPTPSAAPMGGKNVRGKLEEPKSAKPVGVQNQDPTQNGRVNTSTALSPLNENSMGVGVQFDLSRPKKTAPKKIDKNQDDAN